MKLLLSASLLTLVAGSQAAILFDNGSFTTSPGLSVLEAPGTTFGFGAQTTAGNYVGDDFTLTSASTLSKLTVYTYQTGATTAPTLTGGAWAIYATAPLTPTSGGALAGSLATPVATVATFTNVYRVTSTTLTDTTRRIVALDFDLGGLNLGAGTYWATWTMTGSLASGPWALPVSGFPSTANGIQAVTSGAFAPIIEAGSAAPAALAFQVQGTSAVPEPATMAALGLGVVALVKRRRKQA